MKRVAFVFIMALFLVACAKPPVDTYNIVAEKVGRMSAGPTKKDREQRLAEIDAEIKKQEGKLFKNYDMTKQKIGELSELLNKSVSSLEGSSTLSIRDRFKFEEVSKGNYNKPVDLITDTVSGKEILVFWGVGVIDLSTK